MFNSHEEERSLGNSDTGFKVAKLAMRAGGLGCLRAGDEVREANKGLLGEGRAVDCITIQKGRGQEPGTECSGPCTTYQLSQPSFQCR